MLCDTLKVTYLTTRSWSGQRAKSVYINDSFTFTQSGFSITHDTRVTLSKKGCRMIASDSYKSKEEAEADDRDAMETPVE